MVLLLTSHKYILLSCESVSFVKIFHLIRFIYEMQRIRKDIKCVFVQDLHYVSTQI